MHFIIWFIFINGTWKCIIKQCLNILIIFKTTIVEKITFIINISLSCLFCCVAKAIWNFFLNISIWVDIWNLDIFCWAAYFYMKLNNKCVHILSFLMCVFIFHLFSNYLWGITMNCTRNRNKEMNQWFLIFPLRILQYKRERQTCKHIITIKWKKIKM